MNRHMVLQWEVHCHLLWPICSWKNLRHFMYKKGRVNSNSRIISTDEDPSLRIESSAIINLRGVSTKLNKYIVFTMQTYKKLIMYEELMFLELLIKNY